jgi:hypothetical protein
MQNNALFIIRIKFNWKWDENYRIAMRYVLWESNEEIAAAYRRAVEVLWKFLKTHLKLDKMMSKNLDGIAMQIYAILVYLILRPLEIPPIYGSKWVSSSGGSSILFIGCIGPFPAWKCKVLFQDSTLVIYSNLQNLFILVQKYCSCVLFSYFE